MSLSRPIRATISSAAWRNNLAVVRKHAPHAKVFAVIKADAYGHGVLRAAEALKSADGFALLEIDAAVRLREAGIRQRILLLEGAFTSRDMALAAEYDLSIVVHDKEQIALLDEMKQTRLDVALKFNTGMNRLGFMPSDAPTVIEQLSRHSAVGKLTLMTHFADADGERGVAEQLAVFKRIAGNFSLEHTLANSAAILRYPETHRDWVRAGIMLYGCSPFPDVSAEQLGLQPVMTLASEFIEVRTLQAGDRIGYGGTFEATQTMTIGIVACGYADGYPRHAPTGTPILVNGVRTRTLGRVSMDMLFVDLTNIANAGIGTPVTLWGNGLSADEVATAAGTVSYELLCALAPRVPVVTTNT